MAYIGKSPDGTGVRSRFYYTQSSGGGTSVSGSSDDGTTLTFSDGAYVDVFLNGVLLVASTDYNTSTANTIAGLAALANGDVVEVVVYDIFTVADTVSSLNGGTFSGNVNFSGNIDVDGTTTVDGLTSSEALDVTTSTHANASVFKSTGNTQLFLQDTDASANDQFWGLQVSGGDFNILTCNDDRASGFTTPFYIKQAGTIVSASGIAIGGSGAANTLDDYEEGTWTASFSGTSTTATGYYVKVGGQVFVTVYGDSLNVTSSVTGTVSGLPFTNNGGYTAATITHDTYTNNSYNGYVNTGGTTMTAIQDGTVSGAQTVVGNPKYIMISAVYYTNS